MGLITQILSAIFGGGRNVVAETAQVFRVNAEADANRAVGLREQALTQFGQEFLAPRRSRFDGLMDGINRLPRPALALGTLALFIAAMVDPLWFAARMTGIALVPEPLWWLLGVIVSFYFGARHQAKGQEFQRDLARVAASAVDVSRQIDALDVQRADIPAPANPALADWRSTQN